MMTTTATARAMILARKRKPAKLPVKWSPEIGERIVAEIANGVPLAEIAAQPWSPNRRTLFRWIADHAEFANAVAGARRQAAEQWWSELVQVKNRLLDEGLDYKVARSLTSAAEQLKYLLEKSDPSLYGNKPTTPPMAIQIVTSLDLGQGRSAETVDGRNVYRLNVPRPAPEAIIDA